MILGPGAIGEPPSPPTCSPHPARDVDAFSYHHYGALSERCGGTSTPEAALSEQWLSPAPIRRWPSIGLFETDLRPASRSGSPKPPKRHAAETRWAATFLDTFRYLDQLGRLAKAGVQVVMHNTLAASDYGLLDERTLAPAAELLGRAALATIDGNAPCSTPVVPVQAGLHVYAHCQRGTPGGVSAARRSTPTATRRTR